jgi:hypothetical protein
LIAFALAFRIDRIGVQHAVRQLSGRTMGLLEDELAQERGALGDQTAFGGAQVAQQRGAFHEGTDRGRAAIERRDPVRAREEAGEVAAVLDVDGTALDGDQAVATPVGAGDVVDQLDFGVVGGLEADVIGATEGVEGVFVLALEDAGGDGVVAVFEAVQRRLELACDGFGSAGFRSIAARGLALLLGGCAWHEMSSLHAKSIARGKAIPDRPVSLCR